MLISATGSSGLAFHGHEINQIDAAKKLQKARAAQAIKLVEASLLYFKPAGFFHYGEMFGYGRHVRSDQGCEVLHAALPIAQGLSNSNP